MIYCSTCSYLVYDYSYYKHKGHNTINLGVSYGGCNREYVNKFTINKEIIDFFSDSSKVVELNLNNKSASELIIIDSLLQRVKTRVDER